MEPSPSGIPGGALFQCLNSSPNKKFSLNPEAVLQFETLAPPTASGAVGSNVYLPLCNTWCGFGVSELVSSQSSLHFCRAAASSMGCLCS